MPIENVKHLHITQLNLILLSLISHKTQFIVGLVHIDCVVVICFLLKLGKIVQKLVVASFELLDTLGTVATVLWVEIAASTY